MSSIKKIYKRNISITSQDIGKNFLVHQGSGFFKVTVSKDMEGHKFGEYVFTRRLFRFKKSSNIKK
jgi:ribosomal protein S19